MANTAEMNGWNGGGPNGPGSNGPGWGGPRYYAGPRWHPLGILAIVLGFMIWWPVGLTLLLFKIWRNSMGCGFGHDGRWEHKMQRMQDKMDRFRSRMEGGRAFSGGFGPRSSGNRAFDEYREETLRRLEDEQQEFKGFLDRLRHAKDKAEFDQFMAERKGRPAPSPDQPQNR